MRGASRSTPGPQARPTRRLAGTPLSLLSLAGPGAEDRLRGDRVRIAGDAEVAQRFRELLQQARPDFEEELSRVFGDIAAHQVGESRARPARLGPQGGRLAVARTSPNTCRKKAATCRLASKLEEFLESVDHLREAADRLEARVARLEARRRDA